MYGHVETPTHWVNQLLLFRELQHETGGFTEFVPLGFVHQNTLLFHQGLSRPGPTLAEHLKIHALSRVILAGAINNIQVSWVKLNRQLSQLCLHAGANDYGGTLMEENISREAGATAGQYTSPKQFQSLILELGRIPAERTVVKAKDLATAQSVGTELSAAADDLHQSATDMESAASGLSSLPAGAGDQAVKGVTAAAKVCGATGDFAESVATDVANASGADAYKELEKALNKLSDDAAKAGQEANSAGSGI
jgi:hypothetical protein